MAYAFIAGVRPEYGIYTVIVQSFIGSLFNSQPLLSVGPMITQSLLVASAVTRMVAPGSPELYLQLVIGLTFTKGVLQIGMAAARLGRLVRYVSYSVIVGFTAGAAVLIAAGQIHHLFGVSVKCSGSDWPGVLGEFQRLVNQLHDDGAINLRPVLLGALSLAVILIARRLSKFLPGPLLALVLGGVVVAVTNWSADHLPLVSAIPQGLKWPAFPNFNIAQWENLFPAALALSVLGLMEAYAIGKSLAMKTGSVISANRELFSQGVTNFVSSFFHCIPGSGSFSRSTLNYYAGARSRFAGLFNSIAVLVMFLFFAPLVEYIPMSCIAVILFVIAYELIDWRYLKRVIKVDRGEAVVCIGTFIATLFVPLAYAVFAGVFLNIALYLRRATELHIAEMVQASNGSFQEYPMNDRRRTPSRFLQIEGNLFFGLGDELRERLIRLAESRPRVVIFRLKRTHSIDATVLAVFEQFVLQVQSHGGHVILCGVRPQLIRVIDAFGLVETIGRENIFLTAEGVFASARQALERARQLAGSDVLRGGLDAEETQAWIYEI